MQVKTIKLTDKAPESTLVLLNFKANCISPKRELDLKELGIDVSTLPRSAHKVWKIDILPHDMLSYFTLLRNQAKEACIAVAGHDPMHGFVTTKSGSVKATRKLSKLKEKWYETKDGLLSDYEISAAVHIDSIVGKLPTSVSNEQRRKIKEKLKELQPKASDISERLHFEDQALSISIDSETFDPESYEAQANAIVGISNSVMGSLIKETCVKSRKLLDSLLKRESNYCANDYFKIHGKAVAAIEQLRAKLYELSFIHANIKQVHDAIESVLENCDSRNRELVGEQYTNFKVLLQSLSSQVEVYNKLKNNLPLVVITTTQKNQQYLPNVASATDGDCVVGDQDHQSHQTTIDTDNLDEELEFIEPIQSKIDESTKTEDVVLLSDAAIAVDDDQIATQFIF